MDTHSQQLSNNDIDGFEVRERANTNTSSDDETFRMSMWLISVQNI